MKQMRLYFLGWADPAPTTQKKGVPFGTPLRYLADSNRRTWFCRPLTKPLIQGTGWQGLTFLRRQR